MDVGDVATAATTVQQRARRRRLARCRRRRGGRRGARQRRLRRPVLHAPRRGPARGGRRRPSRRSSRCHRRSPPPRCAPSTPPSSATRHHRVRTDCTARPPRPANQLKSSRTAALAARSRSRCRPNGLQLSRATRSGTLASTVEIEADRPDQVRVRFESGDRRSRITVDWSTASRNRRSRRLTQPPVRRVNRMRPPGFGGSAAMPFRSPCLSASPPSPAPV